MTEQTHRQRIATDNPATTRVNQPGREEAVVRADAHPIEHERPEDWGWHGETGRAGRIASWIAIVFLAAYFIGNHEGRVEDLWLLGILVVLILIKVYDRFRRKNAWRAR